MDEELPDIYRRAPDSVSDVIPPTHIRGTWEAGPFVHEEANAVATHDSEIA